MEELARLLLLLVAVALVINLIKHGPDGAKKWLAAKFLGRNPPPSYLRAAGVRPARAAARGKG
ncbi:MAG: hypothetical protein ACJ75S_08605 [Solirubrobacterales bacterium]